MFTIAIMVPLTLLAFGPIGNTIGGAIGGIYNTLYNLSPIVAGFVVGGIWEILVIFGVHWGITPVTVGNYANLGYDTFTGLQSAAVFSQAGATLGVFLKTKNKEMKGVSASAAITGLFGITEPAIYGVNLRLKKPMIADVLQVQLVVQSVALSIQFHGVTICRVLQHYLHTLKQVIQHSLLDF